MNEVLQKLQEAELQTRGALSISPYHTTSALAVFILWCHADARSVD